MKNIIFIILALYSLTSSAQNRRIEYGDLDLFLIPKHDLILCLEKFDLNYDTTLKNRLCVDIDNKYTISIVYDNDNNVKSIIIENPPYYTMSVWNLTVLDSRGRLCYFYRFFTYSVQYNKNELRLIMI